MIIKLLSIIKNFLNFLKSYTPTKAETNAISVGLFAFSGILLIAFIVLLTLEINSNWVFFVFGGLGLVIVIIGLIFNYIIDLLSRIPRIFRLSGFVAILFIYKLLDSNKIIITFLLIHICVCSFLVYIFFSGKFYKLSIAKRVLSIMGIIYTSIWIVLFVFLFNSLGFETNTSIKNAALLSKASISPIISKSPAEKGLYKVKVLSYGNGRDKHRAEYANEIDIKTKSFDATEFIDNWSGLTGWWRTKYWGFDKSNLPLNARVWYPENNGPFPLVLMVHGDHPMQDFSDSGYGYLGELLASRGYIFVSVDENFLNNIWAYYAGALYKENDARALLLLEHLKLWHEWNQDDKSFFFNKVDISKITLIGHSKGGESIAHAALFNKLPYYPDNAKIPFDYNFNIKSLIAIAPVDGQYKPSGESTYLENIDYLAIHGSHDAEVRSFVGLKQYDRIKFNDSNYHFKSGLYIHKANHGQFNTTWGNKDSFSPFTGILNLKELMDETSQREIAKVYISAFLEASLKNNKAYLPLFLDYRTGDDWLPETIFLNEFEDSNCDYVCTFDEDLNLSTTTLDGGIISTQNLLIWREEQIRMKFENRETKGVVVGWDNTGIPNSKTHSTPSFSIALPTKKLNIEPNTLFIFSMAMMEGSSNDIEKELMDFSLSLLDSKGERIIFPLSKVSYLQEPLTVVLEKADFINGYKESERMLKTFSFTINDIQLLNPFFDFNEITNIEFLFDRTKKGVLVMDNIGFTKSLNSLQ